MSNNISHVIQAIAKIEIVKHLNLSVESVGKESRRSSIIKLQGNGEQYALKIALDDFSVTAASTENRSGSIRREACILKLLDDFTNNVYVASGDHGSQAWLLTKWIDGDSSTITAKSIKSQTKNDTRRMKKCMLDFFINLIQKVSNLHKLGYVHGDLQPVHFIINFLDGVHLIDFEFSKHIDDATDFYKGGLVHYNSPETAKAMLENNVNIPLDFLTEIYSVASVIFFLYTGKTSTYYGSYDYKNIQMEKKLMCIAGDKRNTFKHAGAEPFPELESILSWCLEADRSRRCPSIESAVEEMQKITL